MDKKTGFKIYRICWIMWWIGAILVVLSWINAVNVFIGWFGFGLGTISVVISVVMNKSWKFPKYTEDQAGIKKDKSD